MKRIAVAGGIAAVVQQRGRRPRRHHQLSSTELDIELQFIRVDLALDADERS